MGTEKANSTNERFALLARMNEKVFHASDLGNLWQIYNKNTLHTTLKRYARAGLLYRIYKGLYSLYPVDEIDPLLLGIKAVHGFSYISTETVLAIEGIINQSPHYITLVGTESKRFEAGKHSYYVRQLREEFLYNNVGIDNKKGIRMAVKERAIADLLYFNTKAHFDADALINWEKVYELQKKIGYK